MKHKFLLDENILYLAVKEVNVRGTSDRTATDLVALIGSNCHNIAFDSELAGRYVKHLEKLQGAPAPGTQPSDFLNDLLLNGAKAIFTPYVHTELPAGLKVPKEDTHIVRLAFHSNALLVTEDVSLREAVNTQQALGLRALTTIEALELAKDQ